MQPVCVFTVTGVPGEDGAGGINRRRIKKSGGKDPRFFVIEKYKNKCNDVSSPQGRTAEHGGPGQDAKRAFLTERTGIFLTASSW